MGTADALQFVQRRADLNLIDELAPLFDAFAI